MLFSRDIWFIFKQVKETLGVISSDPPWVTWQEWQVRFTTLPFSHIFDNQFPIVLPFLYFFIFQLIILSKYLLIFQFIYSLFLLHIYIFILYFIYIFIHLFVIPSIYIYEYLFIIIYKMYLSIYSSSIYLIGRRKVRMNLIKEKNNTKLWKGGFSQWWKYLKFLEKNNF